MANKVRFLVTSVLDSATVSASTATTGLPASHLQHTLIRKVWRSTGANSKKSEWIKWDCTSATSITGVFIGNHSFSRTAVVKWQGNSDNVDWTSPGLTLTIPVPTDNLGNVVTRIAHFWQTTQSWRWWRLLVQDTANTSSAIEVGRVMAGRTIQPTRDLSDGFRVERVDPSRGVMTAGRQSYWSTRTPYAELSYSLTDMGEAQADQLMAVYQQVGRHQAFVVTLDPETRPHHNTWYMQFKSNVPFQHRLLRQFGVADVVFSEKN